MLTNTAVITVTYNPDIDLLRRQLSALSAASSIVFVDNGSSKEILQRLEILEQEVERLTLRSLENNTGIANAQNLGAVVALEQSQDIEFLFFLDHDSVPDNQCLDTLVDVARELQSNNTRVGVLGPKLVDPRTEIEYGFHKFRFLTITRIRKNSTGQAVTQCDQVNSSGSLIPVTAWQEVGPFDQQLFIDHVETDWCFRAKHKGYKLFGVFTAKMFHEMGDDNETFWFFGNRSLPYRSPLRHYYIVRNSLFLQKQRYTPIRWRLLNLSKLLFTFVYFGFFATENAQHRKMIIKGVRDGMAGRNGKLDCLVSSVDT